MENPELLHDIVAISLYDAIGISTELPFEILAKRDMPIINNVDITIESYPFEVLFDSDTAKYSESESIERGGVIVSGKLKFTVGNETPFDPAISKLISSGRYYIMLTDMSGYHYIINNSLIKTCTAPNEDNVLTYTISTCGMYGRQKLE